MSEAVDKTGFVTINVSDDKTEARLTLQPFAGEGIEITFEDIAQFLKELKITTGLKESSIRAALLAVTEENVTASNVLVAKGEVAVNGEDGRVEFMFKEKKKVLKTEKAIEREKAEEKEKENHVDFHDVSSIIKVTNSQPLAKLIIPTKGKAGLDVYGKKIEPQDGKECALPVGEGTEIASHDKNLLIACLDGNVKYDGRVITVTSKFVVNEDVDYSVGNIKYDRSVIIKGDVMGGFNIEAGKDIEIGGTVSDSNIIAEGNINIAYGFVGTGKGKLEAKGDITVGFARNQLIIGNNITFLKESIDCTIYAKNSIVAKGGRLSILGGILAAGSLIEVDVLGSKLEVPTEVEVGIDYADLKGLMNVKKEINNLKITLSKIEQEIKTLKDVKESKGHLPPKHQEALDGFLVEKVKLSQKVEDLSSRERIASKRLTINKDAKIIVHQTLYPGVTLKIGDIVFPVRQEYFNSTFYLEGNEIKKA